MKFQKKRVIVDAYQTDKDMYIETLEGVMHASPGDWIITGVISLKKLMNRSQSEFSLWEKRP